MGINLVEKVVAQLRVTLFPWFRLICSSCSAWFYLLLEIPYYAFGNQHSFEEEEEEGANSLLHLKWDSRIYWTLNWLHVSTDDSSSSSSSSSEVHWLDLPDHIVSSHIANRLTRLKDFIQFGAVCRTWRSIYIDSQSNRSPKVPFLMLVNATQLNSNDQTRSLYSLIDKSNSQVQIPHNMHCPGSSHGWLFIVCPKTLQVRMFNPFLSSDKNQIHLPPVPAFELDEIQYDSSLCKAVLSADPVLESTNFQILAIDSGRKDSGLSFYKPGDKAWTFIDSQFDMITDIIYYRDKFVAVNHTGYVFSIDLNHPKPKVLTVAIRPPRKYSDKRYLVELSGDLLQILRYFNDRSEDEDEDFLDYTITTGFDVFKLDQFKRKWILLDNLGGHILFLGDNATYCVSASDFPKCEPNSIYFTDAYYDLDRDIDRDNGVVPHDMGVFRFEDRTIKPHYPMESKILYPVPIWIQPPSCT